MGPHETALTFSDPVGRADASSGFAAEALGQAVAHAARRQGSRRRRGRLCIGVGFELCSAGCGSDAWIGQALREFRRRCPPGFGRPQWIVLKKRKRWRT
jgi:hypothetical protein